MRRPSRPLRICHVATETGFSGGEVQILGLIRRLAGLGLEQQVILPRGCKLEQQPEFITLVARGVEVAHARARNDLALRAMHRARRAIRRFRPDIVHMHTGRGTWLGCVSTCGIDVRLVSTRRMDRKVKDNARNRWIYARRLDAAVSISPAVAALVADVAGDSCIQRVIWSAIEPANFESNGERATTRARLTNREDAVVLLTAASLVYRKGVDLLLDAFKSVRSLDERVRLWVLGDGPERANLESRSKRNGTGDSVQFFGSVEDPRPWLAAADVFCLASRAEGLGVAALEAMASELPVVASNVGGLGQVVVPGESGYQFEVGDTAQLAKHITALVDSPAVRERMGARGRALVNEHYSMETQANSYVALYNELLDR